MHERLFEHINGHEGLEWCTVKQVLEEFKEGRFPGVEIRGGGEL
jgi:hypothetical protein